jgi:hypothetical protein
MLTRIDHAFRQPMFTSLLENRAELGAIVGFGAVHLGMNLLGLPFWRCPILAATGVPCPGCGLTKASLELFHGDFAASIQTHAFAPIFLIAFFIMVLVFILPSRPRLQIIEFVSRLETRNAIAGWVLSALMFYWAARLIA